MLADTFSDTPPDLKVAVQGVARFSQTLDERDAQLRNLLSNANKATKVLAERSDEVVNLVANTNALLVQLKSQSNALDQISNNLSAVAQQIKGFIAENRDTLKPALDKLNGVLTIVDNRKERVQKAIKGLNGTPWGWASRCRRDRSSRPTSSTCCPGSSCSRSSTRPSPTSAWIRTCCCPRSAPTRRSGSPGHRRCRFRTRAPARAEHRG